MNRYSRQDVLRILQLSSRQMVGWERAGLIEAHSGAQHSYSFQDLTQFRRLRDLQLSRMRASSIRQSVAAMRAVSGMANPLVETRVSRSGSRLLFFHQGAIMEPVTRQLCFDFEAASRVVMIPLSQGSAALDSEQSGVQALFIEAVQAEEQGRKLRAIELYNELLATESGFAPAYINLGTIYYHQRQYVRAEELYRKATVADPSYVLAFFDLGNVLDELRRVEESIEAYARAIELSPRYADAHYNLALAYERNGEPRRALAHWEAYVRLDAVGPWAKHARGQIRKLLEVEHLAVVHRSQKVVAPWKRRGVRGAALRLA